MRSPRYYSETKKERASKSDRHLHDSFERLWLEIAPDLDLYAEYRWAAIRTGGIGKGVRSRLSLAGLKDWRFDYAHLPTHTAIELEGGLYVGGRHITPSGFIDDCRKYNTAALLEGWQVFRLPPSEINVENLSAIAIYIREKHVIVKT